MDDKEGHIVMKKVIAEVPFFIIMKCKFSLCGEIRENFTELLPYMELISKIYMLS